jgi:uncharacterized protein YgiM (DUF1202 family)
MKLNYFYPLALLFVLACSGKDSEKFTGTWQQTDDPSKQIMITQAGDNYYFATTNIESAHQGDPGKFNADKDALEFDSGNGTITVFSYNESTKHLVALGKEFEKVADSTTEVEAEEEEINNDTSESAPSETEDEVTDAKKCGKGDALVISGDNVRLRSEADVTKQNILMQLNKGYEVVHLDDKTVDGQKWYKVCYEGQTGWVSGQYAAPKK